MRIGLLAAATLLMCASLVARAEDAQPQPAPEPAPAAQPQTSSSTPKQSLERAPVQSQVEKAQTADRFSLRRVDGGFLRFDAQTGQVAYCNSQNGSWACEAVPEHRAALEKEIEQLRGEVSDLKKQLKAQDEPPRPPQPIPPPAAPSAAPPNGNGDMTSLPGREQISRAAAALQDAWHRFVALVIGVKNDVLRKS